MRAGPKNCTSPVTGNFSPVSMTQRVLSWELLKSHRSLLEFSTNFITDLGVQP